MYHERTLRITLPYGQGDVILTHRSDRVNEDGHEFTATLDNGRDAVDCAVEVIREGGNEDEPEDEPEDDDECVGPDGEWLPRGRCDTCGAPCDADTGNCTTDPAHAVALS